MTLNPLARTAIVRKAPPLPLRWLHAQGLLVGRRRLDYGCGRRTWYGMAGYDPYWKPGSMFVVDDDGDIEYRQPCDKIGYYTTTVCCYVLNVVEPVLVPAIISHMRWWTSGWIYIAVRRDLPEDGTPQKGYRQRYITEADIPVSEDPCLVRQTSQYAIYSI